MLLDSIGLIGATYGGHITVGYLRALYAARCIGPAHARRVLIITVAPGFYQGSRLRGQEAVGGGLAV